MSELNLCPIDGIIARIDEYLRANNKKRAALSVPESTLSTWIRKEEIPNANRICHLAVDIHRSIDYLLTGKEQCLTSDETQALYYFRRLPDGARKYALSLLRAAVDNEVEAGRIGPEYTGSSPTSAVDENAKQETASSKELALDPR
jgi:transcriptional regulator with XRE-family HTH domain